MAFLDEKPEVDVAQSSLIEKFEDQLKWPETVEKEIEQLEELRTYVHTEIFLKDEEDCVATNLILRNNQAVLSQSIPRDPAPLVFPRDRLTTEELQGLPIDVPQDELQYAETHQRILLYQQNQIDMEGIVNGAIQDTLTVGHAWLKLHWQADPSRNVLGYAHENDQQDAAVRFAALKSAFDDGQFTEDSAEHAEMARLEETVRAGIVSDLRRTLREEGVDLESEENLFDDTPGEQSAGALRLRELEAGASLELAEVPEIPQYQGPLLEQIEPEDMRWDWNIFRPEDLRFARWMAHRSFMSLDDVAERWDVSKEELGSARKFDASGSSIDLVARDRKDNERPEDDGVERVAVWEYWDRVSGRVYVWMEGGDRFLDEYRPEAATRRFFPFYMIAFNRVTGKFLPVSETLMQMSLQDEYNMLRTHEREARKSAYPRYVVGKGLLKPTEKRKLEEALPYSIVEIEKVDDVIKSVKELVPNNYDPRLYDRSSTVLDMQMAAGVPTSAIGGVGTDQLATEAAIANEKLGVQTDARRAIIQRLYTDLYMGMAQLNAQLLPPENVVRIAGDAAFWPEVDRVSVLDDLMIEVDSVLTDEAARKERLNNWVLASQVMAGAGVPVNPIQLGRELFKLLGLRGGLTKLIATPNLINALRAAGAPQPAGAQEPTESPDAQGDRGAEGGAPVTSSAPSPESVPNRPQVG